MSEHPNLDEFNRWWTDVLADPANYPAISYYLALAPDHALGERETLLRGALWTFWQLDNNCGPLDDEDADNRRHEAHLQTTDVVNRAIEAWLRASQH